MATEGERRRRRPLAPAAAGRDQPGDGAATPRIGLWRVDHALRDYLVPLLRQRWPGLDLIACQAQEALQRERVDAWLLGEAPPRAMAAPALLLGSLSRRDRIDLVSARLWRTGMPSTGRRLLQALERSLSHEAGRLRSLPEPSEPEHTP